MSRNLIDYQHKYGLQPYEKHQVSFRKRKILEILNKYPHKNLLEVGCGLESIFLDIDSYEKITVVEPSEMFCQKVLEDVKIAKNKNIHLLKSLLEESKTTLKEDFFDFILVSGLLHELSDQKTFLKTLHTIASPQTIIHINVPNAYSFHRLLALEMGLIKELTQLGFYNLDFQQHCVFDLNSLTKIIEENGFHILESGSYAPKIFSHTQMQHLIDKKIISKEMLEGFYKMGKYLPDMGSEIFVNIKKQ